MPPAQKLEKARPQQGQNYESNPDLRDQVPDLIPYLAPGEKVIEVTNYPDVNLPAQEGPPSSLSQILRLAGVDKLINISGAPLSASKAQDKETRRELKLFESVFGRDSLIVADFLKDYYPQLLRTTLLKLASSQGNKNDPASEEEPGKIIHNERDPNDPIAIELTDRLGWKWPFYGSIDATLLFVKLLSHEAKDDPEFLSQEYTDKNGDRHTMEYSLQSALGFIQRNIAGSGLGLVEYKHRASGLVNQFWGDSWDSLSHSDGSIANHVQPIAELSVQAIAYDALIEASELYEDLALANSEFQSKSSDYKEMAANIKKQLIDKFWKQEEKSGFFVAGLDKDDLGNYRQLDIKTCNMGFVLNSRLFEDGSEQSKQMVDQTVEALFTDEMQNASGIRTLSKNERRYKPGGYHVGNVWLWVNNYIANGLDKYAEQFDRPDYSHKAAELREKTWHVVQKFKKFPEFARGGEELEPVLNSRVVITSLPEHELNSFTPGTNTIEQPAQDYQAWTIAAYIDALHKNDPFK